jgi:hypothetical protein
MKKKHEELFEQVGACVLIFLGSAIAFGILGLACVAWKGVFE